jgi:sortase (surface protein transpeptidase)
MLPRLLKLQKEIIFAFLGLLLICFGIYGMFGFSSQINPIDVLAFDNIDLAPINTPNIEFPEMIQPSNLVTTGKTTAQVAQSTTTYKAKPATPNSSTSSQSTLSIQKIGLDKVVLGYGSAYDTADIDKKLLSGPVVENRLTPDICSENGNAYIYGHSEPAVASTKNSPGVYIFSNLSKMKAGDIFSLNSKTGKKCTYKVKNWDQVITDKNNQVSTAEFQRVFYPETNGTGMLTIQTCQKGSSTVRLLLRSELISVE